VTGLVCLRCRFAAAVWLVCLGLLSGMPLFAQVKGTTSDRPAPEEIAAPLRARLAARATTVSAGAATLDFWFVSALPVEGSAPPEWSRVAEGALVGAVRVAGSFKEIRGKTVNPGVYTLRFGLQPQNGDHLGASPNREYLLLSPAAVDTNPAPLGFDGTVAISKQTIGASHPAALSLDPPATTEPALSPVTNDFEHQGLVLEVPTGAGTPLRFGLILIGVIEQ
jgi:hypothetical protein